MIKHLGGAMLAAVFCAAPVAAENTGSAMLRQVAAEVSPQELQSTITRLVAFGTRHSLSGSASKTRGIGPAQGWVKNRFEMISSQCGNCLEIATPAEEFSGNRVPAPTAFMDVLAIQRGQTDPGRVIIIAAHLDSRNSDVMDALHDAPGANDDGSGVAAVLEAARIFSKRKFPATLVYAVLTGEEQGLLGGTVLAHYARDHGWNVEADLNNDIIGNSHGGQGSVNAGQVRVFSQGVRDLQTDAEARAIRYNGGEIDSPSRNLARFIAALAPAYIDGFHVHMIYRTDRYGRGGDQVPMLGAGFPAVRLTEAAENYTRQHQNVRIENGIAYGDVIAGIDFAYLARVTRVNLLVMAALAMAPAPPSVTIGGAVTYDAQLSWTAVPGAMSYRAWWRDSLDSAWTHSRAAGGTTSLKLEGINLDDWLFGVSAI